MLSAANLTSISRARLKDAKGLLSKRRFDGAVYLCGYAVEIALKARIVKTLKWTGFPETNAEFKNYGSFKTHDLDVLVHLTGWETKIKTAFLAEWSAVKQWNPELRYGRPGGVTQVEAESMINSAKLIVGVLI